MQIGSEAFNKELAELIKEYAEQATRPLLREIDEHRYRLSVLEKELRSLKGIEVAEPRPRKTSSPASAIKLN